MIVVCNKLIFGFKAVKEPLRALVIADEAACLSLEILDRFESD